MPSQPALRPDDYLEAGRRAQEAGDFATAITIYTNALSTRQNDPKLLFLLGNAYLAHDNAVAAIAQLEKAASRQRNHPAITGSLAQAYFQCGRYTDAENQFRKADRKSTRLNSVTLESRMPSSA